MKRQGSQLLGDLLKEYMNDLGRSQGILGARVVRCWDEKMEKNIVSATSSRFFKDGTLYVNLTSSILRTMLSRRKNQIIYLLNSNLGGVFVKNLVLR